jgi:hypothetical protein
MPRIAVCLLLCATLCACEPAPEPAARVANSPAPAPVAQTRFYPTQHFADLPAATIDAIELNKARAAGIVYTEFEGSIPAELTILNDTAHEVQTIARLRFYGMTDGGFTDTLWVRRPGWFSEIERATQEHYGLQAATLHGAWARVNFAYDSAGRPQQGWVRIEPPRVNYASYDSLMMSVSSSFADPAAVRFFDRPAGDSLKISLAPSYSLAVLQTRGDWIRVALTMPDTTECVGDPKARVQRRDTVWVPRINASGQRQIISAVAGC